ncbi:universal stress protein [Halococcus agarilyticus]|uniref:universal stress protein n=1 Tax=Halococcus agarilyticus TaxID=1232219 RepID=UPI0006782AF9|nr:universal stress protein [Halococcus agarilyticus]
MAKHLLVPFDGSDQARDALAYALREYPDATITALHVVNPAEWGYGSTEGGLGKRWYEEAREEGEAVCAEATELADARGRTVTTAIEDGVPGETIAAYVEGHDVDHVVIGSHGRSGPKRLLLGSVAETVARGVPVPVTIIG